jgi:hypothetical protein
MIRGTCDKTRLLDLVENFTLFSEHKAGLVKIIGQNHQFLGVNNAITSMLILGDQHPGVAANASRRRWIRRGFLPCPQFYHDSFLGRVRKDGNPVFGQVMRCFGYHSAKVL